MILYINSIGTYEFYDTSNVLVESINSSITILDNSLDSYTADDYCKVVI